MEPVAPGSEREGLRECFRNQLKHGKTSGNAGLVLLAWTISGELPKPDLAAIYKEVCPDG